MKTPGRSAGIDSLRVLLTALVILHHTAIVYGGSGGWYWRQEEDSSNLLLVFFNSVNQSYFMGFFFLLAGYFTPLSYDRKGAGNYFRDRFLRLGLPLLAYFFLLHPFTVAIVRTASGHPLWPGFWQMILEHEFEPGPLWFAEALLLFAVGYWLWRKQTPASASASWSELPAYPAILMGAVGIGLVAFLVRLAVPVGRNILWLQLGYFPAYFALFAVGCAAARGRLLEGLTWSRVRIPVLGSLVLLVAFPVFCLKRWGSGPFSGGWGSNAFVYALWDPLVCWGIILGLLWLSQPLSGRLAAIGSWLGNQAFGAYILHPPVLVFLSIALRGAAIPPFQKFLYVGLAACVGSFAAASVLRLVPAVRKIV